MSSVTTFDSLASVNVGGLATALPPVEPQQRERLRADTVRQVLGALAFVLRRSRGDYPFIDSKFSIISGESFVADDALRGPSVIYTWIQGRGLEALAGHADWLKGEPAVAEPLRSELLDGIDSLLRRVVVSMEAARERNGGRLPFMMSADGQALGVSAQGVAVASTAEVVAARSLSDLFYCKGLVAAGHYLGDAGLVARAEAIFAETVADIRSGRFHFGQVALDPKNPVQTVPGRFSHAGRMIGIGATALFFRCTGKALYADLGQEFIEYILDNHTLTGSAVAQRAAEKFPALQAGDFWEFTDAEGLPWVSPAGQLWADSGHATEFTGLAFAHLRACGRQQPELLARLRRVLTRNFDNGFCGQGIVKSYDLGKRAAINTDMPWWSLPETMRAAALGAMTAQGAERDALEVIFLKCWNVFISAYVRPQFGFIAVQCLDQSGAVSTAIPATPDADPGYHTGLSLLGCLPWLDA